MKVICDSYDRLRCLPCYHGILHEKTSECKIRYCIADHSRCISADYSIPEYLFRIDGIEPKVERMLNLLDDMIMKCDKCEISRNAKSFPFWTVNYNKMAIINSWSKINETSYKMPEAFGKTLMDILENHNISKDECLIMDSVNCRLINGKPSSINIVRCNSFIKKYFNILKPKKVLLLGSYPVLSCLDEIFTLSKNATIIEIDGIKYVRSINPIYCFYDKERGMEMLNESVKIFKEI